MKQQQIENQLGEVQFRKKIYLQQVENQKLMENEFDAPSIEKILNERMNKTFETMTRLRRDNIAVAPYLEIGCERGQRALTMENDLQLHGAAADLSFDMLKSCNHYQEVFQKQNSPLKVCCDAHNLPFRTNSLPFVFCYEFLHHFPEPAPITNEAYRVLMPGGYFYFDEEPYKRRLHFNLYKEDNNNSPEFLNRSLLRKIIGHFFAWHSCNEVDHGIIENENITLKMWKRALENFETKDVQISASGFITSNLFHPASLLKYFGSYLLGGTISGMCRKAGSHGPIEGSIEDTVICPSCREQGQEIPLTRNDAAFACPKCSKEYPVIDGVAFLLTYEKLALLYPDVFNAVQAKLQSRA